MYKRWASVLYLVGHDVSRLLNGEQSQIGLWNDICIYCELNSWLMSVLNEIWALDWITISENSNIHYTIWYPFHSHRLDQVGSLCKEINTVFESMLGKPHTHFNYFYKVLRRLILDVCTSTNDTQEIFIKERAICLIYNTRSNYK